ncbi:MAG: translation initiation factor IF-5A [Candidatus Aenigmarchaeota archaeon]|nr:translation initiation factor IF-5A [Candidatus Aenigmarchaeota archaeon]
MADTTTASVKHLKPGQFVLIDGEVCKVGSIDISKSGKHGSSKARMEANGVFDGRRRSVVKPADSEIDVPIILKKMAQVLAISGNTAQLMDMVDYSQFDAEIPEEIKSDLKEGGEVMYWEVVGKKILREAKDKD